LFSGELPTIEPGRSPSIRLSSANHPAGLNVAALHLKYVEGRTELPLRVGFESQSPAGPGGVASFSAITYDPHCIGNIYK
jgi:hypothetical protein